MRISRPRLYLRIALLLAGGAWLLWRGLAARQAAAALAEDGGLEGRIALLYLVMAAVALLAATGSGLALRAPRRRHTLRLGPEGAPPAPPRKPGAFNTREPPPPR